MARHKWVAHANCEREELCTIWKNDIHSTQATRISYSKALDLTVWNPDTLVPLTVLSV